MLGGTRYVHWSRRKKGEAGRRPDKYLTRYRHEGYEVKVGT